MPAVWWLAAACAHQGAWGPGVAGYVLMMGVCGLRPGEAAGVRIDDLEVAHVGQAAGGVEVQGLGAVAREPQPVAPPPPGPQPFVADLLDSAGLESISVAPTDLAVDGRCCLSNEHFCGAAQDG